LKAFVAVSSSLEPGVVLFKIFWNIIIINVYIYSIYTSACSKSSCLFYLPLKKKSKKAAVIKKEQSLAGEAVPGSHLRFT